MAPTLVNFAIVTLTKTVDTELRDDEIQDITDTVVSGYDVNPSDVSVDVQYVGSKSHLKFAKLIIKFFVMRWWNCFTCYR